MKENKEVLLKYFRDLFETEKTARDLYVDFLASSKNQEINKKIDGIRKDEEVHMKIVSEIIKLIEENE